MVFVGRHNLSWLTVLNKIVRLAAVLEFIARPARNVDSYRYPIKLFNVQITNKSRKEILQSKPIGILKER